MMTGNSRFGVRCYRSVRLLLLVSLIILGPAFSCWAKEWYIGLYEARAATNRMVECLTLQPDFTDSYLTALTIGREIGTYRNVLRLEAEGQWVLHTGPIQKHVELNAVLALRWLWFPWNNYLQTSLTLGDGLSYSTDKPELEIRDMGDTSHFLNYIYVEVAFRIPKFPNAAIFARLHHRSAVYGLIDDLDGGSNFIGLGIRHRF